MRNLISKVNGSIRNRSVIVFLIPLLVVVTFVVLYFPSQQKKASLADIEKQVSTLSEMLAFSVGAGLSDGNFELVQTAFEWSKKDENVDYVAILDEDDEALIEYNPKNYSIELSSIKGLTQDEEKVAFVNAIPIEYKDELYGKIILAYSLVNTNEQISSNTLTSLLIVGLIAVIGIAWVIVSFNKTVKGLLHLREAAVAASHGNLEVEISKTSSDEIGDLEEAFSVMMTNIKTANLAIEEEKRSVEQKVEIAVRESEEQKNYLSESVSKLLDAMNLVSNGDMSVKLGVNSDDDIGQLYAGFNQTVESIQDMIIELNTIINATSNSANSISSSSEAIASNAQNQSMQTNEVASAVQQMSMTVMENAQNATNAAEASKIAQGHANSGIEKVTLNKDGIAKIIASSKTTGEIISNLSKKTDQIGEITQVINDIADQTNLLALNAAIEAARAGEQGRGFAVVADEVRKLAERTTKATKEIAETITLIQGEAKLADNSMVDANQAVSDGEKLTIAVGDSLDEILSATQTATNEIHMVAAASEEQSTAAGEISKSVEMINSVIAENASGISRIASAADELNMYTENLRKMVSRFKVDENKVRNGSFTKNSELVEFH